MCLVTLALLLGAGAAQAQTSVTLISNDGQANSTSPASFGNDNAQAFTTGSNTDGYKLTRVEIRITSMNPGQPTYTVEIWSATTAGAPDTWLATLENPLSVCTQTDGGVFRLFDGRCATGLPICAL